MTRSIPESAREHADLALAVYVEELAARRRVLFVGDAASAVPERLSSVARSVEVVSPRTRARGTRRGGRILPRPWPSAQDARSWDLVLVPDLLWAGPPAPERIAEMAEWLTARGVLVVGAEEREDGLGYEPLFELLSKSFEQVRMLGQAPFAGWAVVDFAPQARELEVTFDGSLLGGSGEEPSRFLAICAAREVVLDPYAIVQVPSGATPSAPREPRAAMVAEEPQVRSAALAASRVSQLEVQLRDKQEDVGRAQGRAEELERELLAVRARVEHAERRLDQAQREITRSSQKLDEARAKADAHARDLSAARGEIERARSAPVESVETDYAQIERSLAERGAEITALRGEIERRGVLVRDLVEELRELRGGAPIARAPAPSGPAPSAPSSPSPSSAPSSPAASSASPAHGMKGAGHAELEQALAGARRRSVEAEAAVAEAGFRLDEVRGELALCRKHRESERDATQRELAARHGTVRGLTARLAEAEEIRRLCEARLALSLDDVVSGRARIKDLERELAEAREHVAISVVREHGRPKGDRGQGDDADARERADAKRELEAELREAREQLASVEAERARLERDLGRASASLEGAELARASLETRLGELAAEAARTAEGAEQGARALAQARSGGERELQTLRGEREGLRLRLADAEASLAALTSRGDAPRGGDDGAEALRAQIASLTATAAEHVERTDAARAAIERESRRAEDLTVRLAARDALIGRLQSESAGEIARRDTVERRARELDATVTQLREQLDQSRAVADVRTDEERREVRRVEERLGEVTRAKDRAEREHEETRAALAEARQILAQIADGLDGPGGAAPSAAPDARMRDRMEALQRESDDRELMLRSLTAQLQDRDDRIRALERMHAGPLAGDGGAIQQRVLLAEERAVRLERELEQERDARRSAEGGAGGSAERDADLRRLHQLLGDRDATLMVLEGRITGAEREGRAMRDAFAQARAGLETLLGEIANDQRAEAADRIASMLRTLRRY